MSSNPLPDPNELTALLERQRRESLRSQAPALDDLTTAYRGLYSRLELRLDAALNDIWNNGGDSVSRPFIERELAELQDEMDAELARYSAYLQTLIDNEIGRQLQVGGEQAEELLTQINAGEAPASLDFQDAAVLAAILALLFWRDTLMEQVEKLAEYYTPLITGILVDSIALGYGPRRTAGLIAPFLQEIKDRFRLEMARPYADALRMTRTAQVWAAREAARQNYRASGIVTGWQWWAKLDKVTCMSCVAMHGTIHSLDETLNDHYNGRCSMLPIVEKQAPFPDASGELWFTSLPIAEQRQMMGPGKWNAWVTGGFAFSELSVEKEDPTYGTMRTEATLKSLTGENDR
jgi:SPP1 gp7 family putative phage head morphogenesis protein